MQTNPAVEPNKNVKWSKDSVKSVRSVKKRSMVERICQRAKS